MFLVVLLIPRTIEIESDELGTLVVNETETLIEEVPNNQNMVDNEEYLEIGSGDDEPIDISTSTENTLISDSGANNGVEKKDSPDCYCVTSARNEGVDIPKVDSASDLIPNSEPRVGGLVLFQYEDVSHVAVIKDFVDEGMKVVEGNYKPCEKTERVVAWNDPFIRGFWSPDNGKTIQAEVSAYTASPEETDSTPNITASNELVRDGIVANNCQPFGTRVLIQGKVYEVADRMNKRYGCNHYDIFMWDKTQALQFGRQKLPITILSDLAIGI